MQLCAYDHLNDFLKQREIAIVLAFKVLNPIEVLFKEIYSCKVKSTTDFTYSYRSGSARYTQRSFHVKSTRKIAIVHHTPSDFSYIKN